MARADQHAVVIGGSMAGLLAGRVLADHYERVTIIERDRLPEGPGIRNGVPQANHVHLLLVRGYRILERLFPGLSEELDDVGALHFDFTNDIYSLFRTGWMPREPSDLLTRACSRALLEWMVRGRLATDHGMQFMESSRVTGLLADATGRRVSGVALDGGQQELEADLVVDATGRESKAPDWLETLGYERPAQTVVDAFLGYATRRYRLASTVEPNWKMLFIFPQPPDGLRGGALMQEEDGTWVATLAGINRDFPPIDEQGFMDYARSLPTPLLAESLKDAEPLTPISGYRRTSNRFRHYERMTRWPGGFVVVGDAACTFNPVYGQGMSTAAMAAEALDENLRANHTRNSSGGKGNWEAKFQKRLAKLYQTPWALATGEDLRYPDTEGDRPDWMTRLFQRYVDYLLEAVPHDAEAARTFMAVIQLTRPLVALFRPDIVAKVLGEVFGLRPGRP